MTGQNDDYDDIHQEIVKRQEKLKKKIDNLEDVDIRLSQPAIGKTIERVDNKTKNHTHVYDVNGICYKCGYQICTTTDGNNPESIKAEIKKFEDKVIIHYIHIPKDIYERLFCCRF